MIIPKLRNGWLAGLNHGPHDSACALLKDGELIVAIEQERISRRKQAVDESPADALAYCLEYAGISLEDLDAVTLGADNELLAQWMGYGAGQRSAILFNDTPEWLFPDSVFPGQRRPQLIAVPHHDAHAGSCFWPSGFRETAILVMDAMGEDSSTTLAIGGPDGINIVDTYPVGVSLGFFFEAACEYVGLRRTDAGKLMGLAAYGRPVEYVGLDYEHEAIVWRPVHQPELIGRALIEDRISQLIGHFARECFPYARACTDEMMAYANFAASVQHAAERVILALAERLRALSGLPRLVIAGGVGLNCTANGKIADSGLFDEIFVQPMAHDAGVALGSALVVAHRAGQDVSGWTPMRHAYWGHPTDDRAVETELKRAGLPAVQLETEELLRRTARIIADGGIVAWHQGRGEVGPRALGARSLLGDPRSRKTLVRLNTIKKREMWRPLAPSVLAEHFDAFFSGTPSEFMIVAAQVRSEVRRLIPAVVHVDGSARPQTVDDRNPIYAGLLEEFRRLTGIPMVVNTSLNVAEEPLCSAPKDTVKTFMECGADAMAIGSFLVIRGEHE